MEVFVYNRSREDFSKYLNPNTLVLKNKTIQRVLGDEEIYSIKFFPLIKAKKRIENIQRQIIDNLIHEDELIDYESDDNDIITEEFD
jgi:hypothetical protein